MIPDDLKVSCSKDLEASLSESRAYPVFPQVNGDAFFSYEYVAFSQQNVFVVQSSARKSFHHSAARLKARDKKPDV